MTVTSPSAELDDGWVIVSNGNEFLRISSDDLPAAKAGGFYQPQDRGLTIVSDGECPFEIPAAQLEWANANGFRAVTAANPAAETFQDKPASAAAVDLGYLNELSVAGEEEKYDELASELEGTEGWWRSLLRLQFWIRARRAQLGRQLGGTGISVLVHVAVILLLASFVFIEEKPQMMGFVATASSSDDVIDEVIVDVTPLDVAEPTDVTEPDPQPEPSEVPMELVDVVPDLAGAIVGEAIKPPAKPVTKPMQKPVTPTVFGSQMAATNYVFVIDNSNSMTKGRFETALYELMLTVNQLTPKQRFYVIFYSDTAYPMMHPNAVLKLVPATDRNKQYLFQWLQTVPLCLKTNGKEAIGAAFQLEPDVIYVLGDGAFTDKAAQFYASRPNPRVIVHTRGMEVNPKDSVEFKKLANAHRGTYKDVGVSPQGVQMAKQYPRPRNNVRGPVWGITLPVTAKKK
ncbi:MAG: VWA domain-containing protein [Rubripirellula sp.]